MLTYSGAAKLRTASLEATVSLQRGRLLSYRHAHGEEAAAWTPATHP